MALQRLDSLVSFGLGLRPHNEHHPGQLGRVDSAPLLALLAVRPNEGFPREDLLDRVWATAALIADYCAPRAARSSVVTMLCRRMLLERTSSAAR